MNEIAEYAKAVETLKRLSPELAAALPDPSAVAAVARAAKPAAKGKRSVSRGDGSVYQRGRRWWVSFQRNGKQVREPSRFTEREGAEKYLRRRLKEVAAEELAGRPFETRNQRRVLVNDLLDELEKDYRLKGGRALPQFASRVRQVRQHFGDMKALSVTSDAIDRYIDRRLEEEEPPSPATLNRETAVLRQAFTLAVSRKKLSSVPSIRRLAESSPRQGFFEKPDFEAVVSNLPTYLQDFSRFAFLTGWRKGEIRSIAWSDVDRDGKVIRLRPEESKNGEGRALVLEGELWQLIERRWKAREYERQDKTVAFSLSVFHHDGEPVGDFRKAWASACKKADVSGRLFHDLRRTAVRNLIRAGVPERVAMKVSGHKTREIFDRYNIVSETDLRQAMERTQAYNAAQPDKRQVVQFEQAKEAAAR